MKKSAFQLLTLFVAALVFNLVFWQEKVALNALLYDVLLMVLLAYSYPQAFKSKTNGWLLAAHIITMITLVMHNTLLSKIAFMATSAFWMAFVQYRHRSVFFASGSVLHNFYSAIPQVYKLSTQFPFRWGNQSKWLKRLPLLVIPILIMLVFSFLYRNANPVFNNWLNQFSIQVSRFFQHFFEQFSWERCLFWVAGLFLSAAWLLRTGKDYFSTKDLLATDVMQRKRFNMAQWKESHRYQLLQLFMGRFSTGAMALRNENTTGIISLLLLNLLLLIVNGIDIQYVWFGFVDNNTINLSEYVHEGAGMLIFSIILAMGVLLFFFRGNLNFYQRNKWLKMGAYAWLLQNTILVVSVFIRDYYYIQHWGLAYKRIGVLVFLAMVLVGLVTVLIKIQFRKTNYYLFRVNGWAAVVLLVSASCIHWDEAIAQYNLARKNTIPLDVRFLLSLSDKTLPLINQNMDILDRKGNELLEDEGLEMNRSVSTFRMQFEARKQAFEAKQEKLSWLSWNASDQFVRRYFSNTKLPSAAIK